MNAAQLKSSIERAKQRLLAAELEMQQALKLVAEAPPGEKTIISNALSVAFAQLKAAREEITGLEKVLTDE
jgi:hypothetical protein